MYCLRRIQLEKVKIRTRNTSWTSDMPYKTKCLWAKCKWLRNIRIEFPLKCEWILKLAGKGPGNRCALNFTKPRGFEVQFKKLDKPKLWLRFSLLVSFLLSVSQRRTQWWEERGVMKGFERAHCHPWIGPEWGRRRLWRVGHAAFWNCFPRFAPPTPSPQHMSPGRVPAPPSLLQRVQPPHTQQPPGSLLKSYQPETNPAFQPNGIHVHGKQGLAAVWVLKGSVLLSPFIQVKSCRFQMFCFTSDLSL